MKRILLTLISVMTLCLSLSAQTYNMVITKADGSIMLVPADEVSNVSFVAQEPVVDVPRHFDVTVTVGQQGGMGRDVTTIMQSRKSLSEGDVIDFKNAGAEINADYTMEAIVKGKYYYQVPVSADRFVKLQFKDNKMEVVQAQPFVNNTYTYRKYCHAWLSDNTLLIMAANGDANAIIWTKLNTDDMSIIDEGKLSISLGDNWDSFTTSGILTYRKSDNKLFYFFYRKKGSGRKATKENLSIAVINANTMAVEQDIINSETEETSGSAYGELLQNCTFFDEAGNLYIAGLKDDLGQLLRIKNGEYNFEAGYNGFYQSEGKLLTTQYMGNGKVLTFSRLNGLMEDDGEGGTKKATGIDSYAYYYSIVDLNAKTRTRLAYNGTEIPLSSGSFSQRTAVDRAAGKAYIGVNTKDAAPCVYVYDIKTGEVTKGVDVSEGYYFEQIRIVED